METPNPENLVVGASSFYMDPTHLRPVPPPLLEFVVEYSGFVRRKVVRLQESAQLHSAAPIGLLNVLDGVSPDYAVVGQKNAVPAVLAPFDAPFQADYGIALADIAARYEHQEEQRRAELHAGLRRLEDALVQQAQHLVEQAQHLVEIEERTTQAEERASQAEARAAQLGQRVVDLLSSRSWRATAPLRLAVEYAYRVRSAIQQDRLGNGIRRRLQGALLQGARLVLRRPRLKQATRRMLHYFPGLESRLRRMLHQYTMTSQSEPQQQAGDLSPRTLRMYRELKKSLDARKN